MSESKASKAQNLARIRDNQRRSRARRKEYLSELEAKLRSCEQMGIEASAEIQTAARKVLDENRKLRALLRERGVPDSEIAAVMGHGDRSFDSPSASAALNNMLGRKIACNPNACSGSPTQSSSPPPTSAPVTTQVAPISIPARRPAPISEYDSQSPLSITSSVDTPPNLNSTPYYAMTMTPAPEIKTEDMTPFSYSFEHQPSAAWAFQNNGSFTPESMAYYNTTSCVDAANIIRSMTVDVGPELEADFGCRIASQDCYVDNSMVFNMIEKYSAPVNGIM